MHEVGSRAWSWGGWLLVAAGLVGGCAPPTSGTTPAGAVATGSNASGATATSARTRDGATGTRDDATVPQDDATVPRDDAMVPQAEVPTTPCPEHDPSLPTWALALTNPPRGSAPLTGLWLQMDPRRTDPGPLTRAPFCWEGFEGVALVQDGDRVQAYWLHRPHASGAERRVEVHRAEYESGHMRGDRLELAGYHARTEERMDAYQITRRCHPTESALVLDQRSGHLRGTHAGVEVTLVPVRIVTPPGFRCGPPPP